ncbi:hypothetical protein D920_00314 [Enterococcus faecalis 13-SD-W-01]|nr:hypothetical protein D920_00314 [Enterococcus faecalis 13-SD-W-01]
MYLWEIDLVQYAVVRFELSATAFNKEHEKLINYFSYLKRVGNTLVQSIDKHNFKEYMHRLMIIDLKCQCILSYLDDTSSFIKEGKFIESLERDIEKIYKEKYPIHNNWYEKYLTNPNN